MNGWQKWWRFEVYRECEKMSKGKGVALLVFDKSLL